MKRRGGFLPACLLAIIGLGLPATAQAKVFGDVLDALAFAGFDLQGQTNILGDGANIRLVNLFQNQTFDAGLAELTLNGPFSIEISTTDRIMSTFDVSIQTALTRELTPQPLTYDFLVDVGGQRTRVNGDLLMDMDFSVNGFGYYRMNMAYSSRQTTTTEGHFGDEVNITNDFDIGPIDIRGNLFADLLALITDPLFEGSGTENPFEAFSGRNELLKAIAEAELEADSAIASGESSGDAYARLAALTAMEQMFTVENLLGSLLNGSQPSPAGGSAAFVPEPSTMLLLLCGGGVIVFRGGRRMVRRRR
jgi:hypothetical protein